MENGAGDRSYLKMPVVVLFGSQLLSGVFLFLVVMPVLQTYSFTLPGLPVLLAVQGLLSAVIGAFLGLARWWAIIQVALPFAAFYSLFLKLPAWVWLLLFVIAFLVYKNSFRTGVPLYLSNARTWEALEKLLPAQEGIRLADLGGGLGGTALYLGQQRRDAQIVSIESAPIPALISKLRQSLSGLGNVEMRYGDFWTESLSDFQAVYAFLSPVPMERLYQKVKAEMKPGSLFISNSFEVPGVEADEILELDDGRRTRLHIWRL